MSYDEEHGTHSEHVVEISNESPEVRVARRRSFATISVAVCLALAGVVTAFAFVRDQSEHAADRQRDALQREQLLDGWTTLGIAAAQRTSDELRAPPAGAANNTAPASAPVATTAPVQNVIVVSNPAAPQAEQPLPATASTAAPAAATPMAAPPVGVPAPPSAPNQTPLTPAPGSPDTVLSPITYPASQSCGLTTCNVDSVCCNVSCGICTAPGGNCPQNLCG